MSRYDIDNYMPILKKMAAECKGGYVLELGIGQADGSTKAFAEGLSERGRGCELMISVDHQQDFDMKDAPQQKWWKFVVGDTTEKKTMRDVFKISGPLAPDILFIDTDHTYAHMKRELYVWSELVNSDTVWLFHDTYMFGFYNPMADAIKEFAAGNGWEYSDLDTGAHGLGMMRKKK